jgi:hypothetical protein
VKGIQATGVSVTDGTLTFAVPQIAGGYQGTLNAAGTAISGTWSQAGNSLPLDLTRDAATPERTRVVKGSDIDGDWEGSLAAQLRLVVHITTFDDGASATFDSPNQGAFGLPITGIARQAARLQFEMKQLAASFSGTVSHDASKIEGVWSQLGNNTPLVLKRPKKP